MARGGPHMADGGPAGSPDAGGPTHMCGFEGPAGMPASHMEVDSGSPKDKQQSLVPVQMDMEHERVTHGILSHWDSGCLRQKPTSILSDTEPDPVGLSKPLRGLAGVGALPRCEQEWARKVSRDVTDNTVADVGRDRVGPSWRILHFSEEAGCLRPPPAPWLNRAGCGLRLPRPNSCTAAALLHCLSCDWT